MKNEVCKIKIPDELIASVNTDGSLVTIEERDPEFKDGDVIYSQTTHGNVISIFSNWGNGVMITYADLFLKSNNFFHEKELLFEGVSTLNVRLATNNEKAVLFDRIKREGYQWNADTKTLDKIYVPKDGDVVFIEKGESTRSYIAIFSHAEDTFYRTYNRFYCCINANNNQFCNGGFLSSDSGRPIRLATEEEKQKLFDIIKENKLSWNSVTKTLDPLKELFKPNKGDYVFIKTIECSHISIFNNKKADGINLFCNHNLTNDYWHIDNTFMYISNILEMRLATSSEIKEFDKQLISQNLMWNPYLEKFVIIPKRGDLCIFYDKYSLGSIRVTLFNKFNNNNKPMNLSDVHWDYCIPYDEKLYKQMIGFK